MTFVLDTSNFKCSGGDQMMQLQVQFDDHANNVPHSFFVVLCGKRQNFFFLLLGGRFFTDCGTHMRGDVENTHQSSELNLLIDTLTQAVLHIC